MRPDALAIVLCAAVIHAAWNALAKRGRDQLVFLWSSFSLATLALAPAGLALAPAGGIPDAAMPFLTATSVIHAAYFYALGRAYGAGEFSLVYPIARGLGVALVPVAAFFLLGERLSLLGGAGVALVAGGIAAVSLAARPGFRGAEALGRPGAATAWALATGLSIAAYSVVDKAGVARLHPVPYIVIMGFGMSLLLLPPVWRRRGALVEEWRRNWRAILVAASLNLTSYLLVLFAFRLSPAGYVVAAREVSIVLSVLIGRFWLGDQAMGRRLAGAAVVLAGVVLIALAR